MIKNNYSFAGVRGGNMTQKNYSSAGVRGGNMTKGIILWPGLEARTKDKHSLAGIGDGNLSKNKDSTVPNSHRFSKGKEPNASILAESVVTN
jgi:hypothetical protein